MATSKAKKPSLRVIGNITGTLKDLATPVVISTEPKDGAFRPLGSVMQTDTGAYIPVLQKLEAKQNQLKDLKLINLRAIPNVEHTVGRETIWVYGAPHPQAPNYQGLLSDHLRTIMTMLKSPLGSRPVIQGLFLSFIRAMTPQFYASTIDEAITACDFIVAVIPFATLLEECELYAAYQAAVAEHASGDPNAPAPVEPEFPNLLYVDTWNSLDTTMQLTDHMTLSYYGLLLLVLAKLLTNANHAAYVKKRLEVFGGSIGLTTAETEYLVSMAPSLEVCDIINRSIGNRQPFRRAALTIALYWEGKGATVDKYGNHRRVAEVLKVLFSNTDATHIALIERYIVNEVPALLASKPLRAEAPSVFCAINRLLSLGDHAPFARMLYTQNDVPELQRNRMRLAAAYAQVLAVRDYPSFSQYANPGNESLRELLRELEVVHHQVGGIAPKSFKDAISHLYGIEQVSVVSSLLQPNTQIATLSQLLNKDDDDD